MAAKKCAICQKDSSQLRPLSYDYRDVFICPDCHNAIVGVRSETNAAESAEYLKQYCSGIKQNNVKTYIESILAKASESIAQQQELLEAKRRLEAIKANVILSTTPSLEGYRIVEYLGPVYGETLFMASFIDSIVKDFKNFGSALRLSSTEMSGVMFLLEQARDFATEKIISAAMERGANAIVGLDCESSGGIGDLIHITMCGTAVKVVKIETAKAE